MRRLKGNTHNSNGIRNLVKLVAIFLTVQEPAIPILVNSEPDYVSQYINNRIETKYHRNYLPKQYYSRYSYNEVANKDTKRGSYFQRKSSLPDSNSFTEFLNTFIYQEEAEGRHATRTHQYLYNITNDQGLDTNIYVPFLEAFLQSVNGRIYTIYPGTIWCGIGNQAPDDSSVGFFSSTDNCCREHDRCNDSIPAKGIKYGLRNPGYFTRSHCDCDKHFYQCLKYDNSFISRKIGMAYFNILRPQCYRREFPVMYCWIWYDGRCLNYIVDDRSEKIWQWFDNRPF